MDDNNYMAEYVVDAEFRRLWPRTTYAMCEELDYMAATANMRLEAAMTVWNTAKFKRAAQDWRMIMSSMNATLIAEQGKN